MFSISPLPPVTPNLFKQAFGMSSASYRKSREQLSR